MRQKMEVCVCGGGTEGECETESRKEVMGHGDGGQVVEGGGGGGRTECGRERRDWGGG